MVFRVVMAAAALNAAIASVACAEGTPVGYSIFGTPGLIEMPIATPAPDAEIAMSLGGFEDQQRASFTFQITPRLSGTFRYARLDEYTGPGTDDTFDRSFDLQYQLVTEGEYRPSIAVGLRDFMGTGLYTSEYVVASKSLSPSVRVTGGLGWGRMGSYNGFTNPLGAIDDGFETRPSGTLGVGGVPSYDQFFRGDAAFFGGIEWVARDDLTLVAEYSSDAYTREVGLGTLEHNSPLNFGLRYRPNPGLELGAYYLRGSEIGFSVTRILNPRVRQQPSGYDRAPAPVAVRAGDARLARSWDQTAGNETIIVDGLTALLTREGMEVTGIDLGQRAIRLRYTNTTYRAEAQAIGRIARIMSDALPPAIETFVFEPMRAGIPVSSITIQRSDLEDLENTPDAAWASFTRAQIGEAGSDAGFLPAPPVRPAFEWGLTPYVDFSLFDGDSPVRTDYGIEGVLRYEIQPNIVLSSRIRYGLGGDSGAGTISPSTLHPVRRNGAFYGADGGLVLETLALNWYQRLGDEYYGRVSAGYLERMFAGVSGEVLWKPVDSRLALGAEVSYVAQRDYDMGFGLQDFSGLGGTYSVMTGHVSGYYDFDYGFHGRVDAGRYLAGDWGATFALDREFANGWSVGAYATFTDVSYDDFGEGSFDKGILVSIPLDGASGLPTRDAISANLSSLQRDGGARLRVDGRLYDVVRDGHEPMLSESWGRFWR